jgi:uncharacterized membrane protein YfcA
VHPGLARDALTFLLGVVTGVLSAAFGVGGAIISTPGIRALGASATLAIGTTLPSILPSALTGTVRYVREQLILWRVVRWTVPAGLAASVGGSLLSKVVPGHGHYLMVLTALLLGLTAWRMARAPAGQPAVEPVAVEPAAVGGTSSASDKAGVPPAQPPAPLLVAIGAAAGMLSGLLGIGGGIVMVPAFTELAGLPIKQTIATSLVCVGLFAVPGTITHALLGDIGWRFAVALSVGVVPGARLGAVVAIRSSDRRLRLAVAGFLGLVSVVYATGELIGLR